MGCLGGGANGWAKSEGQNGGARTAILICPTSWTRLVNMYDVRVSCYVWPMSRIIFIRRNEHDFLVLGLRNNGLEVVKGGLDLLTNFPLAPLYPPCAACLITKSDTETERSYARAQRGTNKIFPILRIEYAYYYFIISRITILYSIRLIKL